jgi:hypothetical protein
MMIWFVYLYLIYDWALGKKRTEKTGKIFTIKLLDKKQGSVVVVVLFFFQIHTTKRKGTEKIENINQSALAHIDQCHQKQGQYLKKINK